MNYLEDGERVICLKMKAAVCIGVFILFFGNADSSCLFPTDLNGAWLSSTQSLLNIASSATTTTITGYTTAEFGPLSSLDCLLTSGNKYVFRSSSTLYLGVNFYVYVCFVLTPVTSKKYVYHLGSVENPDAANERLKSYTTISSTTITIAVICDRSTFAAGTEHLLLKNDGTEADSKTVFPEDFHGTWNYTYNSGSGDLCGIGSEVNICSDPDTSTMIYNYTNCATIQAYSATGFLYAMWNTSDSNYTYVHVYNNDTSTDESTTYRFTCYVAALNGGELYATQNPKECLSSQTSTSYTAPGAALVYTMESSCGSTVNSADGADGSVLAMASTAGLVVGILVLVAIVICAVLIWYYHKKRKEKEALDKIPLQKTQPANKRLTNGDLIKRSHIHEHDNIPVPKENGDVTLDIDTDPDIRRENSICVSVVSRGNSAATGLMNLGGPAPVEEPEKVNFISYQAIVEDSHEDTLASTFLPISPAEKQRMNHTNDAIQKLRKSKRDSDDDEDNYDMDDIDDELGLPRLSGAFTPTIQPETAPLPVLMYKKESQPKQDDSVEITADGVLKVKLKKRIQRKFRILSSKSRGSCKRARPKSGNKQKKEKMVFNFMGRIKKHDKDKVKEETKEQVKNQASAQNEIPSTVEKEAEKARVSKRTQRESKYLVDSIRDKTLRSANERVGRTSSSDQRRRFGDPPLASAGRYRKKTPRLRHPMEIQADNEGTPDQKEPREKVHTDGEAKRDRSSRSGRRRGHPEAVTIPSVKEDPFDHQERPTTTSAFSEARGGRSAGLFRSVNHSFLDPPSNPVGDDVWNKVSHMWKDNTPYCRPSHFSNLVRQ